MGTPEKESAPGGALFSTVLRTGDQYIFLGSIWLRRRL
jgi:hypothetical protein